MVGRLLRNTIYTFTLSLLVAFAAYLVLGNYAPDRQMALKTADSESATLAVSAYFSQGFSVSWVWPDTLDCAQSDGRIP